MNRQRRAVRSLVLLAVLSLGGLASCGNEDFSSSGFGVRNDLGRPVQVSLVADGVESDLSGGTYSDVVEPAALSYFTFRFDQDTGCSEGTILARDTESQEVVARIEPPLCHSHQAALSDWVLP